MRTIARKNLSDAKAILTQNGITLPDSVIAEMLLAAGKLMPEYEIGDFVAYSEGMGEMGHGTVTAMRGEDVWTSYTIRAFGYGSEREYPVHVGIGDMRGISTPEEAMAYFRERTKNS